MFLWIAALVFATFISGNAMAAAPVKGEPPTGNTAFERAPRVVIPSIGNLPPTEESLVRGTAKLPTVKPAPGPFPKPRSGTALALGTGAQGVGCVSGSTQPAPIIALASALKCNVWLIVEYLYNNIEFEPLYGSNKGALGTLLDRRGNDADFAILANVLLDAAGYTQLGYYLYGSTMDGASISSRFGVKNDYAAILNLLNGGGIPYYDNVANPDGTLQTITVYHFAPAVNLGGQWYLFNPSFKNHTITAGMSGLATALGYSRTQFLSDVGGTVGSYSIAGPSRSALRTNLVGFSNNLIGYINANDRTLAVKNIIGGKTIDPVQEVIGVPMGSAPFSTFPADCPYQTPARECRTYITIRMPGAASNQAIKLYTDEVYGHRITVFSVPSGSDFIPTLLVDGAAPACVAAGTCTNVGPATAAGQTWSLETRLVQPNQPNSSACPSGVTATACRTLTVSAGGSYLVSLSVGQVGRGMAEYHRQLLAKARAAGNADSSEPVLGESLAVTGYNWLAQYSAIQQAMDPMLDTTTTYKFAVGITGQRQIQQTSSVGPYVDLPVNGVAITNQSSTGSTVTVGGYSYRTSFLSASLVASQVSGSLESAVLQQTQAPVSGMTAASTIKLLDANVAGATPTTYFADGTTSGGVTYYTNTIVPAISSYYSSDDLTAIGAAVSAGNQVLIPTDGTQSIGVWTGAGYSTLLAGSGFLTMGQLISGGMAGGNSGTNVVNATLAENSTTTVNPPPNSDSISNFINLLRSIRNRLFKDPVDAIAGAYTYQNDDLIAGAGGFPYALSFSRSYTSSQGSYLTTPTSNPVGMGNGWKHGYSASIQPASDPYTGIGLADTPAVFAATTIAALVVMQDLMSITPTAQTMTVSSLAAQWLTDQLTNNTAAVSLPNTSEQFVALPRADGATAFAFSPPPGSSARLSQSAAGTFQYLSKDGTALNFGGSAPDGALSGWVFPNGMAVDVSYSGSNVSQVTNTLGRSLTLTYLGDDLTAVTDDTGRSVSYGFDTDRNLRTFTDPLGAVTQFQYDTSGTYDTEGRLTQFFYPSRPGNAFLTNWYDPMGRVVQQANANGALSYLYLAGSRSELVDAVGNTHVTYQTDRGRVIKDAWVLSGSGTVFNYTTQSNGVVNVSTHQYDGLDRPTLTTFPEGNSVATVYEATNNPWANNVASVTRNPKPGSGLSATTTTFTYDPLWNKPSQVTDALGRVSRMSYDPATGNLLSTVADAGGSPHFNVTSRFSYNSVGQVLTVTNPMGTVTANAYDGSGNLVSVTADAGSGKLNLITGFAYDALGNVVARTDPKGNTSTLTYDAARRLVTTTGPPPFNAGALLVRTTNAYGAEGQLLSVTRANGGSNVVSSSTYTPTGQVASTTDPNGNITRYGYDGNDRLVLLTQPAAGASRVTSFTYDALGRTTAIHNTAIQANPLEQYAFTPNGQQATFTDANGNATGYAYDGFDRLVTTTYAQGTALASSESLTYDALDNVLTRTTRAGQTISLAYDSLNRLCTRTIGASPTACTASSSANPTVWRSYDLASRLIGVRDNGTSVASVSATASYATSLGYDQLNRPTHVSWDPAPAQTAPAATSVTFTHGYSPANQRISQSVTDSTWLHSPSAASTTNYTANALNQYSGVNTLTPTYDANGNLTCDGWVTYAYDAENRLTGISSLATPGNCASTPTLQISYAYDAQGRRKSRTVGGTTTIFVTDADNREVLEYDGTSGAIQAWYAFGPGPDGVLNRMDVAGNSRQTLIPDIQGSVMAALDSGGTLTKYGYLPFGENASLTTAGPRYTGRPFDPLQLTSPTTAWGGFNWNGANWQFGAAQPAGLYYSRARNYSPDWGRFLQADPIGYAGGTNLYAYVANDPLNATDPTGNDVYIGGRVAVGGGGNVFSPSAYHLTILLNPNDTAAFSNRSGWSTSPMGLVATLGGQPSKFPPINATLESRPNYPGDQPSKLTFLQKVSTPPGMTDTQFINALIQATNAYQNNLPYSIRPDWTGNYNSNSFVSGVLRAAGAIPPELETRGEFQAPGYSIPISIPASEGATGHWGPPKK